MAVGIKMESTDNQPATKVPGSKERAQLTLGPVLFNWPAERWRDFYFRIADEAPVDIVYVGEVVCAKRQPFIAPILPDVIARLQQSGKTVVLSTLALSMTRREIDQMREIANNGEFLVEANDIAALSLLSGRDHIVGPSINVYNEGTIAVLQKKGAIRIALPAELSGNAVQQLAAAGLPLEIQVFGRAPLAISARCYHARVENLHKDGCRFVCERDPDGLAVNTLDGAPFLAVNGLQTLSHGCLNLAGHVADLRSAGVHHFRLSPHDVDMVAVARLYRDLLEERAEPQELADILPRIRGEAAFIDGFYRGTSGAAVAGV
jgi:collagenase-like PrtC family protease